MGRVLITSFHGKYLDNGQWKFLKWPEIWLIYCKIFYINSVHVDAKKKILPVQFFIEKLFRDQVDFFAIGWYHLYLERCR